MIRRAEPRDLQQDARTAPCLDASMEGKVVAGDFMTGSAP